MIQRLFGCLPITNNRSHQLLLSPNIPPALLHRCKPLLIATYNPEEGPLREHLLDRIAVCLSADVPQSFGERVEAIDAAVRFQDDATGVITDTQELTDGLRTNVILAREYLKEVVITPDQVGEEGRGWEVVLPGRVNRQGAAVVGRRGGQKFCLEGWAG